jgi:hypothetical protein
MRREESRRGTQECVRHTVSNDCQEELWALNGVRMLTLR